MPDIIEQARNDTSPSSNLPYPRLHDATAIKGAADVMCVCKSGKAIGLQQSTAWYVMHSPCCQRYDAVPLVEELRQLKLHSMELLRPVVEHSFEVRCHKGLGVNVLRQALHIAGILC